MIQFPNNRITYTGKQGPVYDNDGQNAINNLYSAVNMLLGLSPTGFAILSGFAVVGNPDGNNIFGPGYFYLNGIIYYSSTITEGQCLVPNITQINNAQFSDGVSRNTYQIYGSTTSNTATGSTSPLFTNNMDSYRLNLTVLNNLISALTTEVSGKAGKVTGGTSGNFAALNGSGDLIDSGNNAASFDAAGAAATAESAAIAAAEAYTDGKFLSGYGSFIPNANFASGSFYCNYLKINGRYIVTVWLIDIMTHTANNNASIQALGLFNSTLAPPYDIYFKATYLYPNEGGTNNQQNYFHIDTNAILTAVHTESSTYGISGSITYII